MGIKSWLMNRNIKKMSKEEKQEMMEKMMDTFFASMTAEEKKEMMEKMMPQMMGKMFEGMTAEDRGKLMASMMPKMMSSMMPEMMREMMGGGRGTRSEGATEMHGEFKPWRMCPCREICEREFKVASAP